METFLRFIWSAIGDYLEGSFDQATAEAEFLDGYIDEIKVL